MAHEELKRRLFAAFATDLAARPAITLRGADSVDSFGVGLPFDEARDECTPAYLEHFGWAITLLDAAAWRHYLPLVAAHALDCTAEASLAVDGLIQSLRPPDRSPPRLGSLDATQRALVRECLQILACSADSVWQEPARRALAECGTDLAPESEPQGACMRLVGMLDSPYVRRVAISLQLLGLRFQHQALSVFRTFEEFRAINPVVKAPTLVCDDGTVLTDSALILEYAEAVARPRSLMPADLAELRRELRLVGLALVACEKSVQVVYERGLRPPEKRHEPWLERIGAQLHAAYDAIEAELAQRPLATARPGLGQAAVSTAVAWQFTHKAIEGLVDSARYPRVVALSAALEALEEFRAAPYGDDTYPVH